MLRRLFNRDFPLSGVGANETTGLDIYDWAKMFAPGAQMSFNGFQYQAYKLGAGGAESGQMSSNPAVFAIASIRVQLFSEARFQWQQLRNGRPGDLFGNADLAILEEPWAGHTTSDMLAQAELDIMAAGNSYWVRNGEFLQRLDPAHVKLLTAAARDQTMTGNEIGEELIGYAYVPDNDKNHATIYLPEEVCHYKPVPNPMNRFLGLSWLSPCLQDIATDDLLMQHKQSVMKNGAALSTIVSFDPATSREQFDHFVDQFRREHDGPHNANKTLFLGGGADVKTVGQTFENLMIQAVQGAGEVRIAAAAGIPAAIVGFSEGLKGSTLNAGNYGEARRRLADAPQPLDAKLLTPDGWTVMGDVAVGDEIIGVDGKPHSVVGVFDQEAQDVYRVEFLDGGSTECSLGHMWTVATDGMRRRGHQQTIPLSEMIDRGFRTDGGSPRFGVPLPDPVEYRAAASLPIDAYLLGLLLGDGTFRAKGTIKLAASHADADETERRISELVPAGVAIGRNDNPTVVELSLNGRIQQTACQRGHEYTEANTYVGRNGYRQCRACYRGYSRRRDGSPLDSSGYGDGAAVKPSTFTILGELIDQLGLLGKIGGEKFIPVAYLRASVADRVSLLQGLVDSDGCVTSTGDVRFSSASPRLVDDVVDLVRSLGGHATVRRFTGRTVVDVGISRLPDWIIPARLERKVSRYRTTPTARMRSIVKATVVRHVPTRCIKLDYDAALYLTDDFIVTHNTMRPLWRSFAGSMQSLLKRPPSSRLYYDDRDIAFLREDLADQANILAENAKSVMTLVQSGWDPDAAIEAVVTGDLKRLAGRHLGLYSVQLQPPMDGTMAPDGTPQKVQPVPTPALPAGANNGN